MYQHPTPPLEPPDFSQYVSRSDGQAPTAGTSGTSAGSPDNGRAKIGADLKSLLLEWQSGSVTSGRAGTSAGTAPSGTSEAGNGDVVSDLKRLFGDLQSVQGNQGGHRHHHGAPPPSDASQGSIGATTTTAIDSTVPAATLEAGSKSSSPGEMLGYLSKALQNYASQKSSGPSLLGQSNLTLSA